MTALEDRLREDLPELADRLVAQDERPQESPSVAAEAVSVLGLLGERETSRRWPLVAVAAAVVAAVAVVVGVASLARENDPKVAVVAEEGPQDSGSAAVAPPTSFGTWAVLADAPIDPRPHAVSAWTGDEVVFWAGSSLGRGFAYTDGAAYDPMVGTWRTIVVPGWGHPGLTSAFFNGELYALAKGGGSRFDPVRGGWADLPQVQGMFLAATVATDEAIWGLGPAGQNPVGQPDLAVARYVPSTDSWVYSTVYEGTDDQASIVNGLGLLESSVHWVGSEIIVWGREGSGIAFDPSGETWRNLANPEPPSGRISDSVATVTDAGLTVLFTLEAPTGSSNSVGVLGPDGWTWLELPTTIGELGAATISAAGEWLLIFSASQAPITLHIPSGASFRHDDAPLDGVEAPNAVWTGQEMIVWGGVQESSTAPAGVTWTPGES